MNGFGRAADPVRQHLDRPGRRSLLGSADPPSDLGVLSVKGVPGDPVSNVDIVDPTYSGSCPDQLQRGAAQNPITDTSSATSRSLAPDASGDAYDAKSGFGLWANEMPEPVRGQRSARLPSTT